MWMNDADDFWRLLLLAPLATLSGTKSLGTKSSRGTPIIPKGTLKGVHFVRAKDYVQVTGTGDLTKINVKKNEEDGELDPHGADNNGNPIGDLIFGNTFGSHLQYAEWTSFISATQFCRRACTGPDVKEVAWLGAPRVAEGIAAEYLTGR